MKKIINKLSKDSDRNWDIDFRETLGDQPMSAKYVNPVANYSARGIEELEKELNRFTEDMKGSDPIGSALTDTDIELSKSPTFFENRKISNRIRRTKGDSKKNRVLSSLKEKEDYILMNTAYRYLRDIIGSSKIAGNKIQECSVIKRGPDLVIKKEDFIKLIKDI